MIRECGWCKKILGLTEDEPLDAVTTGICPKCLKIQEDILMEDMGPMFLPCCDGCEDAGLIGSLGDDLCVDYCKEYKNSKALYSAGDPKIIAALEEYTKHPDPPWGR